MPGGDSFFVDTNVILYSLDLSDAVKHARARLWLSRLWDRTAGRVSWQVLQEFYVNAVRKMGVDPKPARAVVRAFAQWRPPEVTLTLFERAWYWSDRAQLSLWDAMVVAAAERAECRWLLSEDFQADQRFGSVTVVNPFLRSPKEFGLD